MALQRFGERKGFPMGSHLHLISLGQGQGPLAESIVKHAAGVGDWVCLQNCHLAESWMGKLEEKVGAAFESFFGGFRGGGALGVVQDMLWCACVHAIQSLKVKYGVPGPTQPSAVGFPAQSNMVKPGPKLVATWCCVPSLPAGGGAVPREQRHAPGLQAVAHFHAFTGVPRVR